MSLYGQWKLIHSENDWCGWRESFQNLRNDAIQALIIVVEGCVGTQLDDTIMAVSTFWDFDFAGYLLELT
jgi:hypothetical protein